MKGVPSLQRRLLALVLGVVALVWLAAAAKTALDVRHELDELLDGHLAQAAALLVAQQSPELGDDHAGIDAPTLHRYAPKVTFQVFHEGRLALRSANAPLRPMLEDAARHGHDRRADEGRGFATVTIDGVAWRVFSARGAEHDVQVIVGEQVDSRSHILYAVLRSTLAPLALALPLLALVAWWAVRQGLGPLRALSAQLSARQPQALAPLDLPGAPQELQPLVGALNGLFERIGTLMEGERRFTADAAHELRTPIAAIRAQAQVALAETEDTARHHALGATLAGCDRAARLVEQLLTLSRVESGQCPAFAPVMLDGLVRREVATVAGRAIAKNQGLAVDAEPCTVMGDATLLAVLVRNLVDNAIRYAPPGARVQVEVGLHAGRVRLRVQDGGAGLPEPERRRLGERFFRALGSGEDGSGLGWSIVRRIAAVHGFTVKVDASAEFGGLDVTVEVPSA